MAETSNNRDGAQLTSEGDQRLNERVFRAMLLATSLSVLISAFVGPWRFTVGLLIGGVLALLSHRWLRKSAAAAINLSTGGAVQRLGLFQFLLRYVVVGSAVYAAYEFGVASLAAMLLGLSSFVLALMAEALREFYFAIIHREEIG